MQIWSKGGLHSGQTTRSPQTAGGEAPTPFKKSRINETTGEKWLVLNVLGKWKISTTRRCITVARRQSDLHSILSPTPSSRTKSAS